MNRLTKRFSDGQVGVAGCGTNCKYDFKYCYNRFEDCPTIDEIYEKLAQYEDIGLTPEQLLKIDKMYEDRCKDIAELEKKVKRAMTNHKKLAEITGCEEPVGDESFKMILEKIRDDIEHGLFESNYDRYLLLYKDQIKWLNSKAT